MQKILGRLTLALVVAVLVPSPAAAQAKIRIAIWDFENNSAGSYWFSNDLGKAARNQIDTFMAENARSRRSSASSNAKNSRW